MNALRTSLALLVLLLLPAVAAAQTTIYVDASLGTAGDGASWSTAYSALQDAFDEVNANPNTDYEIWIAEGTYYPDIDYIDGDHTDNNRGESFTLTRDSVEIYGGFAGTESNRSARDPGDHPVVLSGDIDQDDSLTGNSYHVLFFEGTGTTVTPAGDITDATVLDGVTVTGGHADPNDNSPDNNGGGLYCEGDGFGNACSPTIRNVVFAGNRADADGGAIQNSGFYDGVSSPTITNSTFIGNKAGSEGGAIYNAAYTNGVSSPTITNCTFTGNQADIGGAINNDGREGGASNPTITNTILWGNSASGSGNEVYTNEASATFAHSIVQGSGGSSNWSGPGTDDGGNLDADPLFIDAGDPNGADDTFATADDGLHLRDGSPALDAGSGVASPGGTDITGAERVQDDDGDGTAAVDIGAYEGNPAATYHVDGDGGDDGNRGTSWSSAFATLTKALSVATGNDEIWIAEGTYTPVDAAGIPEGKRDTSFVVTGAQDSLEIYGGFEGTESSRSDRDPGDHPVVLSGDIDGDGTLSGNSYHVLYFDGTRGEGITTGTVLNGVIVADGNANSSFPHNKGGGIACEGSGTGNECSPTIRSVVFTGNHVDDDGGAIHNNGTSDGTSSPVISNVLFTGNSAPNGGAIYNNGASSGTSNPQIISTTFSGNSSSNGEAIYNDGVSGESSPTITNAILWNNSTGSGGEVSNENGSPTFAHSIVQGSGGSSNWSGPGTDGGGNLDADPLFVDAGDPDGADDTFATPDDGLRIGTLSPALNAGDDSAIPSGVTTDLTGASRIQDGGVDMGAYEGGADAPVTFYVDGSGGNDANVGTSWSSAFATLTKALSIATGNDEIWIAAGTYFPDEGPGVIAEDVNANFTVTGAQDSLEIFGGFQSGDSFSDRSPADHPVVLSGDVDGDGTLSGNSYHVLLVDGGNATGADVSANVTGATVLDGVTVTGGRADVSQPDGGGLYCDGYGSGNECSPTLRRVIFAGNSANFDGGAIYNDGASNGTSSPTLVNAVFTGNSAEVDGGAIYNDGTGGTSSPTLVNVSFTGNSAKNGGAMYNRSASGGTSSPTITNTILWGNSATYLGDEVYNEEASPTFAHSIVQGSGGSSSWDAGLGTDGGGNLDADPFFRSAADPDGADGTFATSDDGLRLLEGSSALDAGDDSAIPSGATTDVTGASRVQNGSVDLGAYEGSVPDSGVLYHVDHDDGDDGNDGESWSQAFATLTKALSVATGNDEIWIAEGTYTPVDAAGTSGRDASFTVSGAQDGLKVYGGFAGTETQRSARDPQANETILSGRIRMASDSTDNSYHVLYFDGTSGGTITANTVLDGVTVAGGHANLSQPDGGGLYCAGSGSGNACSPTLRRVTFTDNSADRNGGAIFNDGELGESSPVIVNATFTGNRAAGSGGAIFNEGSFTGTSSPQITDATFTDNSADADGGAIYNDASQSDGVSSPKLTNVSFTGNHAGGSGGAFYSDGTGTGKSSPILTNVVFAGNSADMSGGAMYNTGYDLGDSNPTLTNVTFTGSSAATNGGAMYNDGTNEGKSSPILTNVVFADNSADADGGAIYNTGYDQGESNPTLANVTFTGNSADGSGGGLYNRGGSGGTSSPTITNTILWGNSATGNGNEVSNENASPTFAHSIIQGSGGSSSWDASLGTDNGDNLDTDPQFVDASTPAGGDGTFGTSDDGLRLKGAGASTPSPAIDAGDNSAIPSGVTTDLLGASRTVEGDGDGSATVDLGAYEYSGPLLPVELVRFDARTRGDAGITLTWQTASETNNAGFRVERREGQRGGPSAWTTVGRVEGAGTTSEAQSYRFTDENLPYEVDSLSYRLKQVDLDGTTSFSAPIVVGRGAVESARLLDPYPNPTQSRTTVRFAIPAPGPRAETEAGGQDVQLHLYDVLGRRVQTVRSPVEAGRHELRLNVSDQASGVYFLRLVVGSTVETEKLTVVH